MITQYSYEDVIDKLNNGQIQQVRFCVNNYPHYKDCVISRKEEKFPNGNPFYTIEVLLTKDSSEKYSFYKRFSERTKLFRMGRKGSFTLKQIWPQITVLEIVDN